jgi:hypothetical protein
MPAVFTKPYAYDLGTSLREKSLYSGYIIEVTGVESRTYLIR